MWDAILERLGVDPVLREHWSDVRLAFQYPEFLWACLVILPLAAWAIIRRHRESIAGVPPASRRLLSGLRIAVLAILLFILSAPFLSLDVQSQVKPLVAVVVDQTRSMDLNVGAMQTSVMEATAAAAGTPAPTNEETRRRFETQRRVDLAQNVLAGTFSKVWAPVAEKYDLKLLALRSELTPLGGEIKEKSLTLPEPPKPGAERTRLGEVVTSLVEESAGRPVAGIVLLTDGQNTAGASLAQAAFTARRAGAPVFAAPVGSDARLKDVAVVDLFSPGAASVSDQPRISATIQSFGFDEKMVDVVLKEGDVEIERKPLQLSGSEQQHLDFTYKADKVGLHVLTVEASPSPGEALLVNNKARTTLRVSDEKLKVLLVDGLPRWDFRFLRNAAANDRGLTVESILEAEADQERSRKSLPDDFEGYTDYAAVVLGDVSAKWFTTSKQQALLRAVRDKGLGLIIAAGPRAMPHDFLKAPIEPLFPMIFDPGPGRLAPGYEAFRLDLAPAGRTNEATRLYDDDHRNDVQWSELPEFHWAANAVRLKPGASALAVNRTLANDYGQIPMLALQRSGEGTVLFLATDSTWHWRQNVGDRYFYKFWGQAIRHVARRPGGKDRIRLEASPLQTPPGEETTLTLTGNLSEPSVEVSIERSGGTPSERTTMTLLRDENYQGSGSRYVGRTKNSKEGVYTTTYVHAEPQASVDFAVLEGSEEFQHPEVNREALDALASATNGAVVGLHELDKIPPLLKGETSFRPLRKQQELWDQWFILAAAILLYCIDVGLRRWMGLM
jgi:hypothetical protein